MVAQKILFCRRGSLKFALVILFFMLFFVSFSHDVFAADPAPLASLVSPPSFPSQIGPAETFSFTVHLENAGLADGCGGGLSLYTEPSQAVITGSTLGTFNSRTVSFPTTNAEWYKGTILPYAKPNDFVEGSATVKAPNYKDAKSFSLKYRGWLRPTTSCSGSTIFRYPSAGFSSCGSYRCAEAVMTVVPQDPRAQLLDVPSSVESEKLFTVTIELKELGWAGYNGGGVHLGVENGYIQSNFSKGDFHSPYATTSFIEFYLAGQHGEVSLPVNSAKRAYVTIRAGKSGEVKLFYRSWTRDKVDYLYRDPDDLDWRDGETTNGAAKTPTQWLTYSKSVPIKSAVASHAYYKCFNDDVYWYDSNDIKEEKKDECGGLAETYSVPYCSPYDSKLVVRSKITREGKCSTSTNSCYNTSDIKTVETYQLCSEGYLCGDGKCVPDTLPNLKILPEYVEVR